MFSFPPGCVYFQAAPSFGDDAVPYSSLIKRKYRLIRAENIKLQEEIGAG